MLSGGQVEEDTIPLRPGNEALAGIEVPAHMKSSDLLDINFWGNLRYILSPFTPFLSSDFSGVLFSLLLLNLINTFI